MTIKSHAIHSGRVVTFPDLTARSLKYTLVGASLDKQHWNDMLRLLPLLDAPTLQKLDFHSGRSLNGMLNGYSIIYWNWSICFCQCKIPMAWIVFLLSPAIQAIPLVEVTMLSEQEVQKRRSCLLGVAIMVDHWIRLDGIVHLMCLGILPTTCMEKFCASVFLDQNLFILSCLKRHRRWESKQYKHFSRRCSRQLSYTAGQTESLIDYIRWTPA